MQLKLHMFDLSRIPPAFFEDPFPFYAELLSGPPVLEQEDGSVLISRHALLSSVYKDVDGYSSDKKLSFGPKFGITSPLFEHHTNSLVFNDPPLHTRVRKIMTGALNPRAIQIMEPALRETISRLLDDMAENNSKKGGIDIIEDFASQIPIQIIGDLLGIPFEERKPLRDWSLAILGALEPVVSDNQMRIGNEAVDDFKAYLKTLVSRRRQEDRDPETDVLTRLILAEDAEELSEIELLQNCIFILNAGHETTTNLIGNALYMLWRHPEQKRLLINDPQLIDGAVEEVLRTQSPNQFGNRQTTREIELGGMKLDKYTNIQMCIGAANRDPDVFANPNVFDIRRKNARHHLGFAAGPHVCVGLTLARLEAKIAVLEFLKRFADYEIGPSAVISNRIRFRGYVALPAALSS
jgi:cytochrome P450